jgi:hypothetical protein
MAMVYLNNNNGEGFGINKNALKRVDEIIGIEEDENVNWNFNHSSLSNESEVKHAFISKLVTTLEKGKNIFLFIPKNASCKLLCVFNNIASHKCQLFLK